MANTNYNDERLTEVNQDKVAELTQLEREWGGMINKSDRYYQQQINAAKDWEKTQKKQQQEQSDFAIEQIEQQKEFAQKDYTKEQSGAYVDWQKQSNQYGVDAEQKAAAGMANTGYSESSQVSMYNQYQNRVATAREAYTRAVLNYDNAIKEARLQNNAALAQIAYESLQTQLELSLQGFQYKNQLIMEKTKQRATIEQNYWARYKDVLSQINSENALAEEKRQFDAQMSLEQEKFAFQKAQAAKSSSGSSSGVKKSSGSGSSSKSSNKSSGGSSINNSGTSKFTGSTYNEAIAYMDKAGVDSGVAGGLMTASEWKRRKGSGSSSGAIKNYSSYAEYIKDYVEYATN